jgi:hypothetical protein
LRRASSKAGSQRPQGGLACRDIPHNGPRRCVRRIRRHPPRCRREAAAEAAARCRSYAVWAQPAARRVADERARHGIRRRVHWMRSGRRRVRLPEAQRRDGRNAGTARVPRAGAGRRGGILERKRRIHPPWSGLNPGGKSWNGGSWNESRWEIFLGVGVPGEQRAGAGCVERAMDVLIQGVALRHGNRLRVPSSERVQGCVLFTFSQEAGVSVDLSFVVG